MPLLNLIWRRGGGIVGLQTLLVMLAITAGHITPASGYLVFGSNRAGRMHYYELDVDRQVVYPVATSITWSQMYAVTRDGSHIAYVSTFDGNPEIFVVGTKGGHTRNVTRHAGTDTAPAWSSDGQQLAFTSDRDGNQDIYVTTVGDTSLISSTSMNPARNLTRHPAADDYPVWSPDDREIAFISDRSGNWEIYVISLDGLRLRQLTYNSAIDRAPHWSPDGRQIAFASVRDGNWELYMMDADGSNVRRLTHDAAWDGVFAWLP